MKTLKAWSVLVALLLLGAGVFVVSGAYNFAADEPHWSATEALIGYARHRSVDARAEDITVPGDLSDCLLYTSPSPRDQRGSRMPSSA